MKIHRQKLRCPCWIARFLGIGGKVAYKNLRRARVKYRTTVVSIVVGVALFIGMTTFMYAVQYASNIYYKDMEYQLRVYCYDSDSYEKLQSVTRMEGVREAEIVRNGYFTVPQQALPLTEDYLRIYYSENSDEEYIRVYSLGDEAYARYCSRVGAAVEWDQAIALAEYEQRFYDEEGRLHEERGACAHFQQGDVITGKGEEDISITVAVQTDVRPLFMSNWGYEGVVLFVSDRWMDSHQEALERYGDTTDTYINCENPSQVEAEVRGSMNLMNYSVTNYETEYQAQKSMQLLISIFLYGFITVVALIGITNIFNTITTNMELRAPEFAMLRAVGMTNREFRRMIWLESLFYGGKALLIGIPLGVVISYCFHLALKEGIETDYFFPWSGIGISVAAVAVLLYGTMHYSMGKIKKKNIVETIQNENL